MSRKPITTVDNKQFLIEYIELCRKHRTFIEPCGWENLIIYNYKSKRIFEKELQRHIAHLEERLDLQVIKMK